MRNKYKGEDLRARLGGTIIRYKGNPYLCQVNGEELCLHEIVGGALAHRVEADDPFIDISSLTLGYFNIGKAAVYLSRHPYRRYKQGVDLGALEYRTLSRNYQYQSSDMFCAEFVNGLNNKFPRLKEALARLTNGIRDSVAIHRDVAITKDKDVFKVHVKGSEEAFMKTGTTGTPKVFVPPSDASWATVWILKDACGDWEVVEGLK